jgi:dinuclear metal center YbgI/SA1388 family protein
MQISNLISALEKIAPLKLQESYDNSGLIVGDPNAHCSGVLLALDATEDVIKDAISQKCNFVIAHHPIVFKGLKRFNGANYVERAIMLAIKNDIAIYACHTNLDNVIKGVNGKIADQLGLVNRKILQTKSDILQKLIVYVPDSHLKKVEDAIFSAGAGNIGNYSECSFVSVGMGSFKPEIGANPKVGEIGTRNSGKEHKLEVVFPIWLKNQVVKAMKSAHLYEEVAYEILNLDNDYQEVGAGIVGELPEPISENDFLNKIKQIFNVSVVKHTPLLGKKVKKVALCGGSGSFLTPNAISSGADFFITSDVKYHEFFDADGRIVIADVGHFESEQYTIELFDYVLRQNFPNFAVLKTRVNTNPVRYFVS